MNIIYAQETLNIKGRSVFLAGPTPRNRETKGWREEALEHFALKGFKGTVLVPEMEGGPSANFAYEAQIKWEHAAMEDADIIIFYIPRKVQGMPGFTTNIEFGYWLAKESSKIRLGIPEDAEKCDYIRYIAKERGIPLHEDYKELVEETVRELHLLD